ncbi:MAG: type VI secretion system tube protein Hcp [Acidobacteriota bacterium]
MANIFMKLDSLQGESKQQDFDGWIEVEHVNYSVHSPSSVGTGTGSGVGKAEPSPITVVAYQGAHTPEISKRQYEGMHWKDVTITFLKQTGATSSKNDKYLEIKLKEVFLVGFQPQLGGNEKPLETFTFTYNDIEIEYFKQNDDGSNVSVGKTGYNTKTNVAR